MNKLFINFLQFCSLLFLLFFFEIANTRAQGPNYPEIGKPCPEFELKDVKYAPYSSIGLKDLRGKWFVLDFWGEFCGACIKGMPKLNALRKKYGKEVEFLLITRTYKDPSTVIKLYEWLRKKNELEIPVVFENDVIEKFGVNGLPLIMIVDPKGIVRALTYRLDDSTLQQFLVGGNPFMPRNYLLGEDPKYSYRLDIPLLINDNGSDQMDFIHRSVLTKWSPTMPGFDFQVKDTLMEVFGRDVRSLYKIAYFGSDFWPFKDTIHYGKIFPRPIVEVSDSSIFVCNEDNKLNNFFCYSTSYPKRPHISNQYNIVKDTALQERMQRDLKNYFGFKAVIEIRELPYYSVTMNSHSKVELKTKGGKKSIEFPYHKRTGVVARNVSMADILERVSVSPGAPHYREGLPLVDDSGIDFNIDINIDALYFNEWIDELAKQGIDIKIKRKEMKVLVISDDKE